MMKQLNYDETELSGRWIVHDKTIVADEISRRIEALTKSYLKEIAISKDGWEILYRDPTDGRYWELTYPDSESHGGGAPKLTVISQEKAKFKYKIKSQ